MASESVAKILFSSTAVEMEITEVRNGFSVLPLERFTLNSRKMIWKMFFQISLRNHFRLQLMADESNFRKFNLSGMDLENHVKLDSIALRALNLVPGNNDSTPFFFLFLFPKKCLFFSVRFSACSQPISKRLRAFEQLSYAAGPTTSPSMD